MNTNDTERRAFELALASAQTVDLGPPVFSPEILPKPDQAYASYHLVAAAVQVREKGDRPGANDPGVAAQLAEKLTGKPVADDTSEAVAVARGNFREKIVKAAGQKAPRSLFSLLKENRSGEFRTAT